MQKEMVKAINAAIDEVIADTYDNRDNRFFVFYGSDGVANCITTQPSTHMLDLFPATYSS